MRPFLPKASYQTVVNATNLAGVIHRNGLNYAPKAALARAAAAEGLVVTRYMPASLQPLTAAFEHALNPPSAGVCLRRAMSMGAHAGIVQSQGFLGAFNQGMWLGIGAAAASTSFGGALAGILVTSFGGSGADASPEKQAEWRSEGKNVAQLNDAKKFGLLGLPEKIARNRAAAAHDAGRGLAHAAWTALAVGFNALLWVPRVALAVIREVSSAYWAIIGATVGAARFCFDAVKDGRPPYYQLRNPV